MIKRTIRHIVTAVKNKRGGLQNATDAEILKIWNAMNPKDQDDYLRDFLTKESKVKDAPANRPTTDI